MHVKDRFPICHQGLCLTDCTIAIQPLANNHQYIYIFFFLNKDYTCTC